MQQWCDGCPGRKVKRKKYEGFMSGELGADFTSALRRMRHSPIFSRSHAMVTFLLLIVKILTPLELFPCERPLLGFKKCETPCTFTYIYSGVQIIYFDFRRRSEVTDISTHESAATLESHNEGHKSPPNDWSECSTIQNSVHPMQKQHRLPHIALREDVLYYGNGVVTTKRHTSSST